MSDTPLTFSIDETLRDRLVELATALQRDRSWVINEALSSYLELQQWHADQIREGIADSDAGRTLSTEEVRAQLRKVHLQRKNGS